MQRFGVHKSIWRRDASRTSNLPLERSLDVQVAIIGAGITGLTCALLLKEAGISVVVLEEGEVGMGASGSTTGHITAVQDEDFQTLISDFGKENAAKVVCAGLEAIDQIEEIIERYSINCEFKRVPGYKYTESSKDASHLENEAVLARELGFNAGIVQDSPLPFFAAKVIRFEDQAQFHALKYLYALADQITGDRASLFESTRVHEVIDGEKCVLKTERGEVTADKVILATHTPIGRYLTLQTRLGPYFSYVLGVKLKNPPKAGLYWDTSDPYFYMREIGAPEERLWIVGGCDHKTGQEVNTYERYLKLEEFVRERFGVESISFYWGAEVFESADGLPYIGKIPFTTGSLYAATGYGGVGLTNGTLAAHILCDLVSNKKNGYADLYDPARVKPMASASSFMKENMNVAARMVGDRMAQADTEAVNEIPAGEGRIVNKSGRKIAVYKDSTNHLHALSPVCTHLGGIVHWNSAEKTWDCPCHGGRFSPVGEVMSGPPMEALEKVLLDADNGYQPSAERPRLIDILTTMSPKLTI